MNITVRQLNPDDYLCLEKLFAEFAEFENHPELMTNSAEQMQDETNYLNGFVAVNESNEVIGYATYFFAYFTWVGKSLYMDDLYVTNDYRGKGIGTKLINKIIEKAKQENCKRLRWQVSDWNKPAIKFYESLGAKISPVESNCDINF